MTDIIFEAVSMGVDSIISGAIVVMLVSVLNLSAQLNSYASVQETYAQTLNYYRQYSKYNAADVVAADVVTALFYYDGGVDLYIVDVDVSNPSASYAKLYKKENNQVNIYDIAISVRASDNAWILKDRSTGTTVVVPSSQVKTIPKVIYDSVVKDKKFTTYVSGYNVADVSAQLKADSIFNAHLLEDLSITPSELYGGGTVTGITMLKVLE